MSFRNSFVSLKVPAVCAGFGALGALDAENIWLAATLDQILRVRAWAIVGKSTVTYTQTGHSADTESAAPILTYLSALLKAAEAPEPGFRLELGAAFPSHSAAFGTDFVYAAAAVALVRTFLTEEDVLSDEFCAQTLKEYLPSYLPVRAILEGGIHRRCFQSGGLDSQLIQTPVERPLTCFLPAFNVDAASLENAFKGRKFAATDLTDLAQAAVDLTAGLQSLTTDSVAYREIPAIRAALREVAPATAQMIDWLEDCGYPAFSPQMSGAVATFNEVVPEVASAAAAAGWSVIQSQISNTALQVVTVS